MSSQDKQTSLTSSARDDDNRDGKQRPSVGASSGPVQGMVNSDSSSAQGDYDDVEKEMDDDLPMLSNASYKNDAALSGERWENYQRQETKQLVGSQDLPPKSEPAPDILHKLLAAIEEQTKVISGLLESTKHGFQELQSFASTVVTEVKLSNILLQKLSGVTERPHKGSSSNNGNPGASELNQQVYQTPKDGISEVEEKLRTWEKGGVGTKEVPSKDVDKGIPKVDPAGVSEHCKDVLEQCTYRPHDHTGPLPERQEPECEDKAEGTSERPASSERGGETTVFSVFPGNQDAQRSRMKKEKSKLSFSEGEAEKLPSNIPENRQPSTSPKTRDAHPDDSRSASRASSTDTRPRDVRPKEPTFKSRASSTVFRSRDVRPKEPMPSRSSRHQNRVAGHTLTIDGGTDSESRRLHEALERARAPVEKPAPKARSYDTVLCLDISESMLKGNANQEMIDVAKQFVNGVEDMTGEVEENIGLVTFGGRADIVQHLTNDFSLVRKAIDDIKFGGTSPFFEAMVVCLGAFHGKGGTVSVSGEYDIHPRIVFITDGHITEGSDDHVDRVIDATNTRARFSRLMMDLNPKKDPSMPHPIIFVPVGSHADQVFLNSMAELNDGKLVKPEKITSLCNYYKIEETIGKVIVCMQNMKQEETSDGQIRNVILGLVPTIEEDEMHKVVAGVMRETKNPMRRNHRADPLAFDEVYEDEEGVAEGERLPLGTRVLRGPDWNWGDQDRNGPGTVIQHEEKKHGFTWVLWDGGRNNRYPYGSEMGYHVWETKKDPLLKSEDGSLKIGMIVRKGPSWDHPKVKFNTETGVIIRVAGQGRRLKFQVRWANGVITGCPATAVTFCDPFEKDRESFGLDKKPIRHCSREEEEEVEEEEEDVGNRLPVWQWRDDWGNWRLYSKQENEKLEAAFHRKRTGTCIITRGDKQFRILFQHNTEKDVEKRTERDIQRIFVPEGELQSLEVAEEFLLKG